VAPLDGVKIAEFVAAARESVTSRLRGVGASEIVLHLTEVPPPRLTVIPYRRTPLALISVKGEAAQLTRARESLADLPGSLSGWCVDESVPVLRTRSWPAGERAPGACLLTLFNRNARLGRDDFFHEWYEHHTPLSLDVHPLWGYVRNAVAEPVVLESGRWDGIVTEYFREREDLLSTVRLFGGPLMALPNMARVGLHVSKFIDMRTIQNYLVEEYVLQA